MEDLKDLSIFVQNEIKYQPLHSYVKSYNRQAQEHINEPPVAYTPLPALKEKFHFEEDVKPYFTGFKRDLEKFFKKKKRGAANKNKKISKSKREDDKEPFVTKSPTNSDFFQLMRHGDRQIDTTIIYISTEISEEKTTFVIEQNTMNEFYDYEALKAEYEEQIKKIVQHNNTFNYTDKDKPEESPKDAIAKLINFTKPKNCTKEEMTQIGLQAMQCLVQGYQHVKDKTTLNRMLSRTWVVLRVWIYIYLSIAIPCWCQKGWCCCCFRCDICFPKKRINFAKKYYTSNTPGTLIKQKINQLPQKVNYKPTEFEYKAYENLETAIRNL
ncbi:uncharacterized protein [Prorops nasuta]|uniref:uncharacterized protein n=1 Tax=Prorops nasuta TaxID=863751 RepID=UPI0034CF7853